MGLSTLATTSTPTPSVPSAPPAVDVGSHTRPDNASPIGALVLSNARIFASTPRSPSPVASVDRPPKDRRITGRSTPIRKGPTV